LFVKEEHILAENVIVRDVVKDIKSSYLEYSMDVIVGRALPDVRDGCKPVHHRILHSMNETNNTCRNAYRKSARTVGDVLGKYHPHGDSSVYDAMVRLAQPFSLRYPLIDGHGNFGSIDGDSAAAMRYTEARMSKLADCMMEDIDKDTVDMMANYDGTLKEPKVLPSKFPNMLVNGSQGIAVGFACNMPPHNLTECINAIIAKIDNPKLDSIGLMEYIKGPDFPSGGTIQGTDDIISMYTTGRGSITVRADYEVEPLKNNKSQIIFKNVPYQVNKAAVVASIDELIKEGELNGAISVNDETTEKDGVRIVIELKSSANAKQIVSKLYKKTKLQDNFSANMTALMPSKNNTLVPHLFTLEEMVWQFILHRKNVVTRKYQYLLAKAEARLHILEGLVKALNQIDEVIATIRASKDTESARNNICQKFGFDNPQASAILSYQLQRLSNLEINKVLDEKTNVERAIESYNKILSSDKNIFKEIKKDCKDVLNTFGDERITAISTIVEAEPDEDTVDLSVDDKDVVITITNTGYIRSVDANGFSVQKRGGKGNKGVKKADIDIITQMMTTNKRNLLLCFGSNGRMYKLRVSEIAETDRTSRGQYLNGLIEVEGDVRIVSIIGVEVGAEKNGSIIIFTRRGEVKRIAVSELVTRSKSVKVVNIKDDDEIINACLTRDDEGSAFVATLDGKLLKFSYGRLRCKGRNSGTQRCLRLRDGDYVVSADIVTDKPLLTVTNTGMGKRTSADDYAEKGLGGQGVANYKTSDNIKVVAVVELTDEDDVLVACDNGKMIRTPASSFKDTGRTSKGTRLVRLDNGENVSAVSIVPPAKDEDGEEEG
jgi:DNA gyrase, A subunit